MNTVTSQHHTNTYWTQSAHAVAAMQEVDPAAGLSPEEAARRWEKYGPNSILSQRRRSALLILAAQFASPLVWLLAFSTGLSFFFKEWLDGIAILAVIFINAGIGFWMELQARRSMESLQKMSAVPARVLRNGALLEIAAEAVVPGDLLFVEGGDMITADARLLRATQLQTDESALTGESLPVDKRSKTLEPDTQLAERSNMLYKGTFVTKGEGLAVVTGTGMSTELGQVADMVHGADQAATPLEKKIQQFSKKLIWITLALIGIIFVTGMLRGIGWMTMLQTSIALAVAAIPEGLPIVSTLALAFGMLRMARHQVIVKKLSAVETLGGTNVICTDKTGTLTQNRIEVAFLQLSDRASALEADVEEAALRWQEDESLAAAPAFDHICRIAALCNTADYHREGNREAASGDPLEVSLLKMVWCTPVKPDQYRHAFPRLAAIPFSSETMIMATTHRDGQRCYVAVKGAVEAVLASCTAVMEADGVTSLNAKKREQWLALAEVQARSGLRLLAFAYRHAKEAEEEPLQQLTLAGMIGFIDPPRPEVPAAIKECKRAGIRVIMITGDHPATAKNIAVQLGIAGPEDEVIHGRDMRPYEQLSAADREQWLQAPVFARVSPGQKLDLVTLLQENRMVVGMTGDGVNDAPALKKADIGIAMGERGTQVAQEVADMILKNDAFSSIVVAIKQGRIIFDNIRRFVIFLLSCNLSELFVIAVVALAGLHFQLFPLQILFINLVTDVWPALALGVTDGGQHIMQRKPYASDTAIIDRKRWKAVITYAAIISTCTIGAVLAGEALLDHGDGVISNNVLFYTLIFSQVFHVFNMSFKGTVPFHRTEVFRNRYVWYAIAGCMVISLLAFWITPLRKVMDIVALGWQEWGLVLAFSLLSLLLIQLCKKRRWII